MLLNKLLYIAVWALGNDVGDIMDLYNIDRLSDNTRGEKINILACGLFLSAISWTTERNAEEAEESLEAEPPRKKAPLTVSDPIW